MKVLWQVSGTETIPYNKNIHLRDAQKFLYWEEKEGENEEILLVGWPFGFSCRFELNHGDLKSLKVAPRRMPDGAGAIFEGKVDRWTSYGLGLIDTPEKLRTRIKELLETE